MPDMSETNRFGAIWIKQYFLTRFRRSFDSGRRVLGFGGEYERMNMLRRWGDTGQASGLLKIASIPPTHLKEVKQSFADQGWCCGGWATKMQSRYSRESNARKIVEAFLCHPPGLGPRRLKWMPPRSVG